jgi:hypothetical protein
MADTTFRTALPDLKAVDLGDGTYAIAVVIIPAIVGGTDTTFKNVSPDLKAVDNGDGTYSLPVEVKS